MSQLYLYCPHCASHLPVRYVPQRGTPVKCPRCQQMFAAQQVPAPAPVPLPTPTYSQPAMPYGYGQQAKQDAKMNSVVVGSIVLGGGTVVLVILLLIASSFRSGSTPPAVAVANSPNGAPSDSTGSANSANAQPTELNDSTGSTATPPQNSLPVTRANTPVAPPANSPASPTNVPYGASSGPLVPSYGPNGPTVPGSQGSPSSPRTPGGGGEFDTVDHLHAIRQDPASYYQWEVGMRYSYDVTVKGVGGDPAAELKGNLLLNVLSESAAAGGVEATGTAFVVNSNGVLVTCEHVIHGASQITATLGGQTYSAEVVGLDKQHDLALLLISANHLPTVPLADSDKVELAEEVRAIGFPLATVLGESVKVTKGSISGIDKKAGLKLLQVDATINPGNSGGPLFNDRGEVIGINSAALFGDRIAEVGFAVPSNDGRELLASKRVSNNTPPRTKKLEGPELARLVTPAVAFVKAGLGPGSGERNYQFNKSLILFSPRTFPYQEVGHLHVSSSGELLNEQEGGLISFLFEKIPTADEKNWEESKVGAVVLAEQASSNAPANPFGGGPMSPFGRRGMPGMPNAPNMPGMPDRPGSPDGRKATVIPVVQKVRYDVTRSNSTSLELTKRFELTQVAKPGQPVMFQMSGEGRWSFDKQAGFPRESTMRRTTTVTKNGVPSTQTLNIECRFNKVEKDTTVTTTTSSSPPKPGSNRSPPKTRTPQNKR